MIESVYKYDILERKKILPFLVQTENMYANVLKASTFV